MNRGIERHGKRCAATEYAEDGQRWRHRGSDHADFRDAWQDAFRVSRDGAVVVVAARPEHLAIGAPVGQALDAQVEMVLPIGPSLVYELRLSGGSTIKVTQPRTHDIMFSYGIPPDAPVGKPGK